MTDQLQLIGRSSSHFTRVARIFAHELEVPIELVQVLDLTSTDRAAYAGNPAMKIPSLRRPDGSLLFGTENICRALAELAPAPRRVVWPEAVRADVARNAQELTWHGMAAQVQLIVGTLLGKLPADHVYFSKGRLGFEGALGWLDANLEAALAALPSARDLSLLEVTLFCLIEHLVFRPTVEIEPHANLRAFAAAFGERPSARATFYAFATPRPPT